MSGRLGRPARLAALVAAATVAASPPAAAQPAPPRKAAPGGDTERARALFDAGARAYESGQFEAAIQAFEEAYAISPRDGLLFSLGQANRKQHAISRDPRHLRAAIDHYRRYLERVAEGGRRKDAAEALEQLEPLLGAAASSAAAPPPARRATIVQVSSSTPGAMVSIDGAPPAPAPLTREVPPGVHEVRLSAPGFHDEVQTVEALAGQFLPFTYPLRERPARLEVRGPGGAEVSVDGRFVGSLPLPSPLELRAGRHFVAVEDGGHRTEGVDLVLRRGEARTVDVDLETTSQRDAAWIVLASGAVILAGGGALGAAALVREGDAQEVLERAGSERIQAADVDAYESAREDRDAFATASVLTLAGGALVTLVGIGLFAFDAPEPVAPPRPDDAPDGGPSTPAPGGPSLELGFAPAFGPDGARGSLVGRF